MVHHDLSPRKILFVTPEDESSDPLIKITGFGLSRVLPDLLQFDASNQLRDDPYWIAPELLPQRNQSETKTTKRKRSRSSAGRQAADMWSVGVILYFLICGVVPFSANPSKYGAEQREEIYNQLRNFRKGLSSKHFPSDMTVSKEVKKLIVDLTRRNPSKRLSAQEALRHPWFAKTQKKGDAQSNYKVTTSPDPQSDASIVRRYHLSQFHALIQYKLIVSDLFQSEYRKLKAEHLRDLYRLCLQHDGSGTGVLTSYQFELILDRMATVGFSVDVEKLTKVNHRYSFDFAGYFTSFWMRKITSGPPKATDDVVSVIQRYLNPHSVGPLISSGTSSDTKLATLSGLIGIEYQGFLNSLTHDYMLYHDRELDTAMSQVDVLEDGLVGTSKALKVFRKMDRFNQCEQALEVADRLEQNGLIDYDQFLKEVRRHFDVESLWQPKQLQMNNPPVIGILDFSAAESCYC